MADGVRSPLERWDGPCYQELLDSDQQDITPPLREHPQVDLGSEPYSAQRYTDPAFFRKEVEHVFLKTWQMACREEDIPSPGDTYIFDLVGKSAIVVRQRDGTVKAFVNACLHRGRKLATQNGCRSELRCPYHGFTWGIDGAFKANAVAWDFPEIDREDFPLMPVNIGHWAGFIFVNFGSAPQSLETLVEPLERHFSGWHMTDSYRSAYVAKIYRANWKVTSEAFLENHHVTATHPQISSMYTDANSQIDVFSDHVGRAIGPFGIPGLLYEGGDPSQREMLERVLKNGSKVGPSSLKIEEGISARRFMGNAARANVMAETGRDFSDRPDAEFIDGISYDLFPNFHIWGGLTQKISYRIRPLDHERTLFEIMLYKIAPVDRPVPRPASLRMLSDTETWSTAQQELGYLAGVYDQDGSNISWMQDGLKALGEGSVHFARYSEMRLRNLHRTIDRYLVEGERIAKNGALEK